MRSFFIFLLVGLFIFCSSPANSQLVGVVKATCISEKVVLTVAKADEHSPTEGGEVFTHFLKAGKCGILIYPQIMPLEKKVHAYTDSKGEKTEVWKILNQNHYAIMAADLVQFKLKAPSEKEVSI